MAETLGITPYSPAVDINYARMTSDGLQSLGAQLREDMIAIQANRQVKNLGQQLSQIDPTSEQFPQQLAQAAVANPLGSLHPVGRLAIETLGAAHKQHEQSLIQRDRLNLQRELGTARVERPFSVPSTTGGIYSPSTGNFQGRDALGLPELPEKETPEEREAREKRMIDYRGAKKASSGITPTEQGFLAQYARPTKGLIESEPILQRAGLGLDADWSALSAKVSEGKITRPEAEVANHWLTQFRKAANKNETEDITGEYNFAKGKISALEQKAFPPVGEETPADKVNVTAPDGTPGRIPASQLDAALKAGYTRR